MPIEASPQFTPPGPASSPASAARIRRERDKGIDFIVVETPAISEYHLTLRPHPGEAFQAVVDRAAALLELWEAKAVRVLAFGSLREHAWLSARLRDALHQPSLAVTAVEGAACDGQPIAGVQIQAISGARVEAILDGERPLGCFWRDPEAVHCVLGGITPRRTNGTRPEQAQEMFGLLQGTLLRAGMDLRCLARTWLFLDDLLSWYGEFNQVRTGFFSRAELRPGAFPASTGVSGRNPAAAALTAGAWAVQPLNPHSGLVTVVSSPRQGPAPAYGSSFSRAVEIQSPGFRQLLVSGTASITPDGKTAHVGDVRKQIDLSMEVVEAILRSRYMSLADVSRATAYFKSGEDVAVFQQWLARHDLKHLPVVNVQCDICRDDLLFEIELDAIQL